MPEAVNRLNAYNTAVAQGLMPPTVDANTAAAVANGVLGVGSMFSSNPLLPTAAANALAAVSAAAIGNMGVVGEGGVATKPHREL